MCAHTAQVDGRTVDKCVVREGQVFQVVAQVFERDRTGAAIQARVVKIVVKAIDAIGLLDADAPGANEEVAVGHVFIAIAKHQHAIGVVGKGAIADHVVATFHRDTFGVTTTGGLPVAVFNQRSSLEARQGAVAQTYRLVASITATPGHIAKGAVTDAVLTQDGPVWGDLNHIALGGADGLVFKIAVRDFVALAAGHHVDALFACVAGEVQLAEQVVTARHLYGGSWRLTFGELKASKDHTAARNLQLVVAVEKYTPRCFGLNGNVVGA